ncbi:hypothetical protein LguiB_020081 [Lonicera macranthoides]
MLLLTLCIVMLWLGRLLTNTRIALSILPKVCTYITFALFFRLTQIESHKCSSFESVNLLDINPASYLSNSILSRIVGAALIAPKTLSILCDDIFHIFFEQLIDFKAT